MAVYLFKYIRAVQYFGGTLCKAQSYNLMILCDCKLIYKRTYGQDDGDFLCSEQYIHLLYLHTATNQKILKECARNTILQHVDSFQYICLLYFIA